MFYLVVGCYATGLILIIAVAVSIIRSKRKEELDFIDPT